MSDTGQIDIPFLSVSGLGITPVSGVGAVSFRIDNDGLGGLSIVGMSGSMGIVTAPGLAVAGMAISGNAGSIAAPFLSVSGVAGSTCEVGLPALSVAAEGNPPATGEIVCPAFEATGTTTIGVVCQGAFDWPVIDVAGGSLEGIGCQGGVEFILSVSGMSVLGARGSGRVNFVFPRVTGSAEIGSPGRGSVVFPDFALSGHAIVDPMQFSAPLVYDREAIR